MSEPTRREIIITACADAFRGDGEIMASPMGPEPALGARLAKATFEPDLLMTDGVATIQHHGTPEGWMPYRFVFDTLWWGKRHVMMGATQIDRFGNQNIAAIGDWERPKVQLLGARGAPGNTICHTTSYWVPKHGPKVFVERVDYVSGVGYDRAAELSERQRRFHEIRRVISDLAVMDFETPDHSMRVRSLHPGVSADEVREATGFELAIADDVPTSREPTAEELERIRSWTT